MDKRPFSAGCSANPYLPPYLRQQHKHTPYRNGSRNGSTAEDLDDVYGKRRYRRAETAAKDDAHNNAHNVRVHILQYAFRPGTVLGN